MKIIQTINPIEDISKKDTFLTVKPTPLQDTYHLRKRAIIETTFDQPKNICQTEYSRHRSGANHFNNTFAALIAYNFKNKKPSPKNKFVDTKQSSCYKIISNLR